MSKGELDAFMGEYVAFTEGIKKSGHYVPGEALQPVQTATTVRIRNGKVSTTDGPFAETKEQLGGFYLIEAQGSQRCHPGRVADSRRPGLGIDRGAADHGLQPAVACTAAGRRVSDSSAADVARAAVDAVYRAESRRVLATLIRLLGDFDLAEEAMHDAFTAALEQWPRDGVPANPRAWLVSTGRFKAIDALRRRARFDASLANWPSGSTTVGTRRREADDEARRGRPAAADLHLLPSGAAARRADRAHAARGLRPHHRGDRARLPDVRRRPSPSASCAPRPRSATPAFRTRCRRVADLPDRLDSVLHVIYLVFNEGYSASSGASLTRHDLSGEAIRLGRLLVELLPSRRRSGCWR